MIKTTYLKINQSDYLLRRAALTTKLLIIPLRNAQLCAALYAEVGEPHYWNIYRVCWNQHAWEAYLGQPNIRISQIQLGSTTVGYLELKRTDDAIEIVNFGLLPQFQGRGMGRAALESVLAYGFSFGVTEIWLHTCSLDHPAALSNYYARGFQLVKEVGDNFLPLDPVPGSVQLAA
ncbi:GNAT family N-acetyltransferase [Herbaspirillum sp. alder98]|uniref:GNAT family N-acetyltransferase n=1 Tax=Herbaspirillum sp. alder98 TaxID=2913096 RepID=UPI001CD828EB|nr:GNAT family N-acetyltransferase [Herbaspirillum sp. alder98]MCA1324764.1 GNAT family N-acetyltransferase [Herbaspirillum sp. alder98]